MEYIALIAAVVAILVGAVELLSYLSRPESKKFVRLILTLSLVTAVIVYATNSFYFAPKAAGERFVRAFSRFDRMEMGNSTCADSPLREEFTGLGGLLLSLGTLVATMEIRDIQYSPLSRTMRFTWTPLSSIPNNQEIAQRATVYIESSGFNEYCVSNATIVDSSAAQSFQNPPIAAATQTPRPSPTPDCSQSPMPKVIRIGAYGYDNIYWEEAVLPVEVDLQPRTDFKEDVTAIRFQGKVGQSIKIDIRPLKSGTFLLTSPSGKEIFGESAYYIDFLDKKIETTFQCDGIYTFYVTNLHDEITVSIKERT